MNFIQLSRKRFFLKNDSSQARAHNQEDISCLFFNFSASGSELQALSQKFCVLFSCAKTIRSADDFAVCA